MLEPNLVEDMLFAAHALAMAKVVSEMDTDRMLRIIKGDILEPEGSPGRETIVKLKESMKVLTFAAVELRKILPPMSEVINKSAEQYAEILAMPGGDKIRDKIEEFIEGISEARR